MASHDTYYRHNGWNPDRVHIPPTDMEGAQKIVRRIHADVAGAVTALADTPTDGETFQAVYAAATSKLADASQAAA